MNKIISEKEKKIGFQFPPFLHPSQSLYHSSSSSLDLLHLTSIILLLHRSCVPIFILHISFYFSSSFHFFITKPLLRSLFSSTFHSKSKPSSKSKFWKTSWVKI
ncbi:hypothetical protein MtrunA17_Chr3g0124491 [Medicago truncatula]|uniref:Transmembrane protein n=1 Tax=Medicago truncatula TaxID=3880 RepID=A0A396IZ77_MEDTR|nr:hypothetical protein MtrunA17_Chr3g0124491 [Medicago truncatula]